MLITKQAVAEKIAAYLHHHITLAQLVDWAENAMMEGEFDERDAQTCLRQSLHASAWLTCAAFGLTWEDCEHLLRQLGYSARVDIVMA